MRILILILFLLNFCAKANVYNINTDFFTRFNDECFEKYIFQALSNNHDLKSINEKIKQYRYEISNSLSNELPKLSVGSNYLGAKFPKGDTSFLIKRNSYILPFVANLDDELKELTNNSMGVRIWVGFDEVLHCIVVYPNMEFKKLLE